MKNPNLNVNWRKDPYLSRWLKNKKKGTRASYLSAFKAYTEFTGMTTEELIAESDNELNLKPSERGVPERRLRAFFNWLQNEYERKKRGKTKATGMNPQQKRKEEGKPEYEERQSYERRKFDQRKLEYSTVIPGG